MENKEIKTGCITIFEAINNIKSGKYVLPAFQRSYVWDLKRIEKLWDSILQGFPINTLLFWHLDKNNASSDILYYGFNQKYIFRNQGKQEDIKYIKVKIDDANLNTCNTAVLDGQQRLASLYMSLCCYVGIKKKYSKSKSSKNEQAKLFIQLEKSRAEENVSDYFGDKKFDINFSTQISNKENSYLELNKIFDPSFEKDLNKRKKFIDDFLINISDDSKQYAANILNTLFEKIYDEKLLTYTELHNMDSDDALEMFIRLNNGGKPLSKSNITESILKNYWQEAKDKFNECLVGPFRNYDSDFLVRSAIMIFGDVTKGRIDKSFVNLLQTNWTSFAESVRMCGEILEQNKIDVNLKFKSRWTILVPIIYSIYKNNNKVDYQDGILSYLYRAIFFAYFSSSTLTKLARIKEKMDNYGEKNCKITIPMLNDFNDLSVTDSKIDQILSLEKESDLASDVLYYLTKDWTSRTMSYDIDHLHPKADFGLTSPIPDQQEWIRWGKICNRLPNLGYSNWYVNEIDKNACTLKDYVSSIDNSDLFKKRQYIPDVSLDITNFGNFYNERAKILKKAINELLGIKS